MNKNWTEKQLIYLKNKYKNTPVAIIATTLNRPISSLYNKAFKLNLKSNLHGKNNKKYIFNEDFFRKPNLLNSYWAGFVAADGCIADTQKQQETLQIGLAIRDANVILNFKKDIGATNKIFYNKDNTYAAISLISNKICSDLYKNFNITPRKSLTLKPPKGLTKKQALAFIIGYIDGDGCIGNYKGSKNTLQICGTTEVLIWIHNMFLSILKNIKFKNIPIVCRGKHYCYTIKNKKGSIVLNYLKNIEVPKLRRKWNKIKE